MGQRLANWLSQRWVEAQHFVESNGQPVSSVKTAFKTAVGLAGITKRVSPHTLRRTAATWLMQRGADPWQAAGYLGMSLDVLGVTFLDIVGKAPNIELAVLWNPKSHSPALDSALKRLRLSGT